MRVTLGRMKKKKGGRSGKRRPKRKKAATVTIKDLMMAIDKGKQTKKTILAGARKIIRDEGVDHLSIARLADEVGMSTGAVMYHFKNKRALHKALLEEYADHLIHQYVAYEAMFDGSSTETFVPGYVEWFKDFDKNDRGWAVVGIALLSHFYYDEEIIAPVKNWYKTVYARIAAMPEEKRIQTLLVIMALEGFFASHKLGLDMIDPELKAQTWQYITEKYLPSDAKKKTKK